MKTILLLILLATCISCRKIKIEYKQGEFPLLEYKVLTDTTLDTVHCIRMEDYDYMIKNKKIVAKYKNIDYGFYLFIVSMFCGVMTGYIIVTFIIVSKISKIYDNDNHYH